MSKDNVFIKIKLGAPFLSFGKYSISVCFQEKLRQKNAASRCSKTKSEKSYF